MKNSEKETLPKHERRITCQAVIRKDPAAAVRKDHPRTKAAEGRRGRDVDKAADRGKDREEQVHVRNKILESLLITKILEKSSRVQPDFRSSENFGSLA